MIDLNPEFWNTKYEKNDFPWDIGTPSPPLMKYTEQIKDKNVKILIPGCGNAHDGFELFRKGFNNTFLLDYAATACERIKREGIMPDKNIFQEDFFNHQGQYDYILEQTFFCAINPSLREKYVEKMHALLKPTGKLVGVLFKIPLNSDRPPFGGNKEEYTTLFKKLFKNIKIEDCKNSIPPRAGNELFIEIEKS